MVGVGMFLVSVAMFIKLRSKLIMQTNIDWSIRLFMSISVDSKLCFKGGSVFFRHNKSRKIVVHVFQNTMTNKSLFYKITGIPNFTGTRLVLVLPRTRVYVFVRLRNAPCTGIVYTILKIMLAEKWRNMWLLFNQSTEGANVCTLLILGHICKVIWPFLM